MNKRKIVSIFLIFVSLSVNGSKYPILKNKKGKGCCYFMLVFFKATVEGCLNGACLGYEKFKKEKGVCRLDDIYEKKISKSCFNSI